MEFQRTHDRAPRYVIEQMDTDGPYQLDFSVPGHVQDFAVEVQRPDAKSFTFCVYHTQELKLFSDVLQQMAYGRDATAVLADVDRIRTTLAEITAGYEPTDNDQAEHQWSPSSYSLSALYDRIASGEPAAASEHSATGDQYVMAKVDSPEQSTGLRFTMTWEFPDEPRKVRKFEIAQDSLWRFTTGMMTRSYARPDSYGNSRWPGVGYHALLDDFETSVARRQ